VWNGTYAEVNEPKTSRGRVKISSKREKRTVRQVPALSSSVRYDDLNNRKKKKEPKKGKKLERIFLQPDTDRPTGTSKSRSGQENR